MVGQGFAVRFFLWCFFCGIVGLIGCGRIDGLCDLGLFQSQLKLVEGFGLRSKPVTAQSRQFMLELLDLVIAVPDPGLEERQFLFAKINLCITKRDHRLQYSDIIGQIRGGLKHQDIYQNAAFKGIPNLQNRRIY